MTAKTLNLSNILLSMEKGKKVNKVAYNAKIGNAENY
jgi:hypothetical protein